MNPGDHGYGRTAIDPNDEWRCKRHGEIGVAGAHRLGGGSASRRREAHKAHIVEPLGLQQRLGDVLGGNADARAVRKNAHGRGFKRAFGGEHERSANQTGSADHGQGGT